jgi:hypothetical protein
MGPFELDGHNLEMLRQAVAVADLVARCDELVEAEGPVVDSPQGRKPHPALTEGRAQRALLARLVAGLGLPDGDEGGVDERRRGKPRAPYQLHAVGG